MKSLVEPTATISDVKRCPAPWDLFGRGYIFLFQFPKGFVTEMGCIPAFLRGSFVGGLGAVMIVDYAASNVGPYGELLFIPGKFHLRGKKLNCVTKIYVSTTASVVNGWENWAIPKEQADFFTASEDRGEEIDDYGRGQPLNTKDYLNRAQWPPISGRDGPKASDKAIRIPLDLGMLWRALHLPNRILTATT